MRYFHLALALPLIAYLATCITQVRPGERAVVRRFGKVADVAGPGLYIGLPWGMDRVDRIRADQVRHVKVGYDPEAGDDSQSTLPGQLLTGDHNLVNLQVVIDYAVHQDATDQGVVDYVIQADRTDALVARAAEAVLAEWVAGQSVDDVLIRAKAVLPSLVTEKTQERIKDYHLGIRIQTASVSYFLPPEVRPAFEGVNRAQAGIRTKENAARQEAEKLLREAEIKRGETEQATAAQVNQILRSAQTEAETFEKRQRQYQELRQKNPDIRTAIWWDEMGKLFLSLKKEGRIDLLDSHLGTDGLDITIFAPQPGKK